MIYLHRKSIFLQQWILNKYVSVDNRYCKTVSENMTDLWLEEHCQVHCFNLVNNVYILDYYELVRHQILFH